MDSIVDFLNELNSGLSSIAQVFVSIINYLLFFASLILAVTMLVTEQRGTNIGFSLGKWALITLIAAVSITLAKEVFGVA